jgi:hypothetical protein
VFTIHANMIARGREYATRAEAVEAVGVAEWAMSQENLDIVRRAVDAFVRRDLDPAFSGQ